MQETITVHGFKFIITGQDFGGSRNEGDFLNVCEEIEGRMSALKTAEVASIHRAVTWDAEQDAFGDPDDDRVLLLAAACCHDILSRTWVKPDVPFVSVVAA